MGDPHGRRRHRPAGRTGVSCLTGARAEIEAGRAGYSARPLFWLADPADLFFLQVQGSGRVRLPDGSVIRVGYDGKNGRPYTPIGRVLAEQGALAARRGDDAVRSGPGSTANPAQAQAVMDRNEDYVFFRVLTDADAGTWSAGRAGRERCWPGRSAAVDRQASRSAHRSSSTPPTR